MDNLAERNQLVLQQSIDRILDAAAMANLLGAALSHWQEQYGDIGGAEVVAYEIKDKLIAV